MLQLESPIRMRHRSRVDTDLRLHFQHKQVLVFENRVIFVGPQVILY
jgi:hypothetical protein